MKIKTLEIILLAYKIYQKRAEKKRKDLKKTKNYYYYGG